MAYRRRSIVGVRRSRRETSWIAIGASSTALTSAAALVASLNAAALALRPFTVVRTYLEVQYRSDQSGASESSLGAIAMAVVSDQATAVGVTAVPTPTTEIGSDLFYLHQVCMTSVTNFTSAGFEGSSFGTHYSIDSKAMRKVNNDSDVILVAEVDASQEGATIDMMGRMLIKEH